MTGEPIVLTVEMTGEMTPCENSKYNETVEEVRRLKAELHDTKALLNTSKPPDSDRKQYESSDSDPLFETTIEPDTPTKLAPSAAATSVANDSLFTTIDRLLSKTPANVKKDPPLHKSRVSFGNFPGTPSRKRTAGILSTSGPSISKRTSRCKAVVAVATVAAAAAAASNGTAGGRRASLAKRAPHVSVQRPTSAMIEVANRMRNSGKEAPVFSKSKPSVSSAVGISRHSGKCTQANEVIEKEEQEKRESKKEQGRSTRSGGRPDMAYDEEKKNAAAALNEVRCDIPLPIPSVSVMAMAAKDRKNEQGGRMPCDAVMAMAAKDVRGLKKEQDVGARTSFAYRDVVRKQGERRQLDAYTCKQCEQYFDTIEMTPAERQQRMKSCRHRAKYAPPSSPEHYWSIDFPDNEELKLRGNIVTAKPTPSKKRKKPLKLPK